MCSRKSRFTSLRFSFCSLVRVSSNQLCTNIPHAHSLGQNVVDGFVTKIQLTTDHYACQTSIRPHESLTLVIFPSVFEVQVLPERGSSATPSRRGEFRPRQTKQLPRAVDLKGRLLSCQSY